MSELHPQRPAQALALLGFAGVDDDPSPEALKILWRSTRARLHPDRPEGDAALFAATREAYDAALAWAERIRPCLACKGAGKTFYSAGWRELSMPCAQCGGTGWQAQGR